MKKYLFYLVALLMILPATLSSQIDENTRGMEIGPFISMKAGINAVNPPNVRKNAIAFNGLPDFGLAFFVPLSQTNNIGVEFVGAYSTFTYSIDRAFGTLSYKHSFSYSTLAANFNFDFLTAGFIFGLPISADFGPQLDVNLLNIISEFHIGGSYPVMSDETGSLVVFITAGIMLTNIFNDFKKDDPLINLMPVSTDQQLTNDYNPRAASVSIGFKYMFNL
ncbi:MAG: hypothetical protein HW421_1046 [Ignavibacteria bacterium]|nr:hypothetical protein [Ignavibacteria bacterium]